MKSHTGTSSRVFIDFERVLHSKLECYVRGLTYNRTELWVTDTRPRFDSLRDITAPKKAAPNTVATSPNHDIKRLSDYVKLNSYPCAIFIRISNIFHPDRYGTS